MKVEYSEDVLPLTTLMEVVGWVQVCTIVKRKKQSPDRKELSWSTNTN